MTIERKEGECCGNCVETVDDPDFGGACGYAGEIAGWFWCEHYERTKRRIPACLKLEKE